MLPRDLIDVCYDFLLQLRVSAINAQVRERYRDRMLNASESEVGNGMIYFPDYLEVHRTHYYFDTDCFEPNPKYYDKPGYYFT